MRFLCLGFAVTLGCSSYGSAGGTAGAPSAPSGSGGSASAGAGAGGSSGSAQGGDPAGLAGAYAGHGLTEGKQALIWIWENYRADVTTVVAHASSFTHVSPAFYTMNYAYMSGPLRYLNANDHYDGVSSADLTAQIHAAGLKVVPLVYAGAGNNGTDDGIHNVLNDSPPGTQQNLITAMINEANLKGYDGYNLDWEVSGDDTHYAEYGTKMVSFLTTFKKALNAQGMQLSYDLGAWFVRQCADDGVIDLAQMAGAVDLMIMEDYEKVLGAPGTACPTPAPTGLNCYSDFTAQLQVMCNMPVKNVSIGVIAPDTSAFASQAFGATSSYGFAGVALWPGNGGFLAQDNFPAGQSWYSVFSDFLAPNGAK